MMYTCDPGVAVKATGSVMYNGGPRDVFHSASGVTKDVTFVDASSDEALNNEIDAAYQSKYRRYCATYVRPMIAPQARATTLKLVSSA